MWSQRRFPYHFTKFSPSKKHRYRDNASKKYHTQSAMMKCISRKWSPSYLFFEPIQITPDRIDSHKHFIDEKWDNIPYVYIYIFSNTYTYISSSFPPNCRWYLIMFPPLLIFFHTSGSAYSLCRCMFLQRFLLLVMHIDCVGACFAALTAEEVIVCQRDKNFIRSSHKFSTDLIINSVHILSRCWARNHAVLFPSREMLRCRKGCTSKISKFCVI